MNGCVGFSDTVDALILSTTHDLKVVSFRLWQTKGFYL